MMLAVEGKAMETQELIALVMGVEYELADVIVSNYRLLLEEAPIWVAERKAQAAGLLKVAVKIGEAGLAVTSHVLILLLVPPQVSRVVPRKSMYTGSGPPWLELKLCMDVNGETADNISI